jgi:hypothetical protein
MKKRFWQGKKKDNTLDSLVPTQSIQQCSGCTRTFSCLIDEHRRNTFLLPIYFFVICCRSLRISLWRSNVFGSELLRDNTIYYIGSSSSYSPITRREGWRQKLKMVVKKNFYKPANWRLWDSTLFFWCIVNDGRGCVRRSVSYCTPKREKKNI